MRIAILGFILPLVVCSCASLSGSKEQFFVCSFDTTWEAALESVKDRPLQLHDKEKGVIETGWIEMDGKERGYGAFQRESFGNRERARMTIAVKQMNDVVSVSVLESRQRWHLKGGVTQQSTKWWPIEPSEEDEAAVVSKLNNKLKEKGCLST